jgi:hypothetical protein
MSSSAVLKYTAVQGGTKISDLLAAVMKVPVPATLLNLLGLRLTADVTVPNSTSIDRIVTVNFLPFATATADAVFSPAQGGSGSDVNTTGTPIVGFTLDSPGDGYVAPPIVQVSDPTGLGAIGRATLTMNSCALTTGGGGYSDFAECVVYGGLPAATDINAEGVTKITYQKVIRVAVTAGGSGYSSRTMVTFVGGLTPRGKAAIGTPILKNGSVVGIALSATAFQPLGGLEYVLPPRVIITDPTGAGSGAAATAEMVDGEVVYVQGTPAIVNASIMSTQISGLNIVRNGSGYVAPPTLVFLDPVNTPSSPAIGTVSMSVDTIELLSGGSGYTDPEVTLVPFFKANFPDSSDQRSPLYNLMAPALSKALAMPIVSAAPVLS